MKYFALLASVLFIGFSYPSQAGTIGSVYTNCRVFKSLNYDVSNIKNEDDAVRSFLCKGIVETLISVAAVNCFEKNYLSVAGNFYGYKFEQVVQSIINYAEDNPAEWDDSLVFSMGEIALSNNLVCKEG